MSAKTHNLPAPTARRATAAAPAPAADDAWLHDELAAFLCTQAERLPEARELLAHVQQPPMRGTTRAARIAVRGLTGSSRGWLAAWLPRTTGRTVVVLTTGGDTV